MIKRALFVATLVTTPVQAQDPDLIGEIARFARADLMEQGIELHEPVVFDVRVMQSRPGLHSGTNAPFEQEWSEAQLHRALADGAMKSGTLDSVRTCTTLPSGRESCTLRPTRAVVAASRPEVRGKVAVVHVHFWFQHRDVRNNPDTGEPMQVHFSRVDEIELTRTNGRWVVTAHRKGPPGMSIDR